MKTIHSIKKLLACGFAVIFAGALSFSSSGAEVQKGAQRLMPLQNLKTVGDVEALQRDDTVAMACAKCQTIYVAKVVNTAKGAEIQAAGGKPVQVIGTHACAGCNSTMEIVGHGKAKESKLTHTCKACGDESAFCCATKSGQPTKGMEKK
jgi:hypothetical protein